MYSAMDYKTSMLWCVAALVTCCLGIMLAPSFLTDKPRFYYSPDYEESYTVGDFDQPQIRKIYRLGSTDDPSHIPTNDFELNGWNYHMLEMDKEEAGGQITYTVIFNGTKKR